MAVSFAVELQKARRRHDLLLCLLVPCMLVLWVGGLSKGSPEELANGYSELLYSVPVIHAIMLPVLMSVLASPPVGIWKTGEICKSCYTRCRAAAACLRGRCCLAAWKFSLLLLWKWRH